MRPQPSLSLRTLFVVPLAVLTSIALVARAQTPAKKAPAAATPVKYSALAVNMAAGGAGPATASVTFTVTRWSTDQERDTLVNTLMERGPDAALDALTKMPRAGSIAPTGGVGFDIHFARRIVHPDKSERIVLVTDRPMSLWERRAGARSVDYPFTLVELHLGPNGKGEGKASVATQITVDKDSKTVVLENYGDQPVLLQSVERL
jgi:hypothetical protein